MILTGIDGVQRKIGTPYCGIAGVRRQITKGFNGMNNIRYQHFGVLEGILKCSLHIQYVATTGIEVNGEQNNITNVTISNLQAGGIGSASFTTNSSGQPVLECSCHELLKSVYAVGLIQADFDNGRAGNLCAIQQYYGAPVYVPYSYEVITSPDASSTEQFMGCYLLAIHGYTVWTVGYADTGSGNTGALASGNIQLIAGQTKGKGVATARMTFTDGVYIDGKRYALELDPTPMITAA